MPIRTLNFSKWQLKKIKEFNTNRSEFIREALNEQIYEDLKFNLFDGVEGLKVTTVNLWDNLYNDLDVLSEKGYIVSWSEYARVAVRNKILKEHKMYKLIEKNKELANDDMVIVPGYNGGKPIKTRRLE